MMRRMAIAACRARSGHWHPGRVVLLLALASVLGGCASVQYYGQAVAGHLEVLAAVRPVGEVLDDASVGEGTRTRLREALAARRFAVRALGLPDNGSYTGFAALGRRYVVWNVVATPELSLQPRRFCFLVVGCLAYRGFFDADDARAEANRLRAAGDDVLIGGVRAYSTLGWLDDPLLDTMLEGDAATVAELLFHELTHQAVYVKDDSAFNEALATAVARAGVARWLAERGEDAAAYHLRAEREKVFLAIVLDTREALEVLYSGAATDTQKRKRKEAILDRARRRFETDAAGWPEPRPYARFFDHGLNNARLAAVATYHDLVPGFDAMLADADGDVRALLHRARALAARPAGDRRRILTRLTAARGMGGVATPMAGQPIGAVQ